MTPVAEIDQFSKLIDGIRRSLAAVALVTLAALHSNGVAGAQEPGESKRLILFVPGSSGGGYDQTGRAIRATLLDEGLADSVEIIRSPGAGGLIGLAQFVEAYEANGAAILVGGKTMVGAAIHNRSEISLLAARPVARLNGAYMAIAVSYSSPIKRADDLFEILEADPDALQWIGGSIGSTDEDFVRRLAIELGLGRPLPYMAIPGGGREIVDSLLADNTLVAVSGYDELSEAVDLGEIRVIAVSAGDRIPGTSIPTLKEVGVDITTSNWRGVFAGPGVSDDQLARLAEMFENMARSPSWDKELNRLKLESQFLSGPAFVAFVEQEIVRSEELFDASSQSGQNPETLAAIVERRYRWMFAAIAVIGALLTLMLYQRRTSRRRGRDLETRLKDEQQKSKAAHNELQRHLQGAHAIIEEQFKTWNLTSAECDVGWFLLKGLSLKEIANARGTSEATVRQQAHSIYAKSGTNSRSDFAAFFLEDFYSDAGTSRGDTSNVTA